ncbi:type II toxin-antitoxin system RelB/DinJ family antitoxin [Ruminococcus sp.]|uniref:type II toxin-antitoxin system RelB/DinJ family antitoxin n=1 Tax=Ruminococcus sp. TaxID=41978 RepID=UPI001B4D8118|nr:type II toxin-antitoxin system RelB/DinJ family antitoxin [Ruminococcus sp.]MBP5433656.1 type II toxin-antitoxin system RelB/DinJ family antitoxin [Ruminococcus sp.]
MAQATFSVRMDEDLKKQFEAICAEMGMNMTTAVNIFARAVINQQKIPFIVSAQFKEKEQAE